jgi:peptide chain release factor 1
MPPCAQPRLACGNHVSYMLSRTKVMSLPRSCKLVELACLCRQRFAAKELEQRRSVLGSGDRSERIRTYNFPENRVTDHRIGVTVTGVTDVLAATKLGGLIDQLILQHQMDALATLLHVE